MASKQLSLQATIRLRKLKSDLGLNEKNKPTLNFFFL